MFPEPLTSLKQSFHNVVQSEGFKSAVITVSAVGLVVFSFQAMWIVTMSVFTVNFWLAPLYFVTACAMIILGLHAMEKHEPQRSI